MLVPLSPMHAHKLHSFCMHSHLPTYFLELYKSFLSDYSGAPRVRFRLDLRGLRRCYLALSSFRRGKWRISSVCVEVCSTCTWSQDLRDTASPRCGNVRRNESILITNSNLSAGRCRLEM